MRKRTIKDGNYTVNNPETTAEIQRQLEKAIDQEERRQTARDILRQELSFLKGDMAQQFNESQEEQELFDEQDDGL
jgi:RNA polymerase-interacting CarD/CdnL/TRCF family regulator